MTTWHRTTEQGLDVHFTYQVDERGYVTLRHEEVEGLMRTGGYEPGPIPPPTTLGTPYTGFPLAG